jgi:hypothetical protein
MENLQLACGTGRKPHAAFDQDAAPGGVDGLHRLGLHLDPTESRNLFRGYPTRNAVWYRNLFGHAGDVASLEDWFDPARLRDDYVPSGWKGFRQTHRVVPGHEFGLKLSSPDKRALIAFLNTL